jgi:antitoxin component YwqK of YwqJK toxin-antitoxin module
MHDPKGRFIWNDKKVYEGGFFNGNLHGEGVIYYPNGQKAPGIW